MGSCYPSLFAGRPTVVGGLLPPLPRGRIPSSPCGQKSCPCLPIIPISPLLCTCLCDDSVGSAAASTPYTGGGGGGGGGGWGLYPIYYPPPPPLSSPPELSVWFVEIQSFLLSSSLLRLKSQRFVPRTTNYPPPIKKLALLVALHAPFKQTNKADFP